jgi:hypothetical protein
MMSVLRVAWKGILNIEALGEFPDAPFSKHKNTRSFDLKAIRERMAFRRSG